MGQLHLFTSYPKDNQRYSVEEHSLGGVVIATEKFREPYKFEFEPDTKKDAIFAERISVTIDNLQGQYFNIGQNENCITLEAEIKTHGLAVSIDGEDFAFVASWSSRSFMSRHSDIFTLLHEIGHLKCPDLESDPERAADCFAVKKNSGITKQWLPDGI